MSQAVSNLGVNVCIILRIYSGIIFLFMVLKVLGHGTNNCNPMISQHKALSPSVWDRFGTWDKAKVEDL